MNTPSKTNLSTKSFDSTKTIPVWEDDVFKIDLYETAVARFLNTVAPSQTVKPSAIYSGTKIDRRQFYGIVNNNVRPRHKTLEQLALSPFFTEKQKEELLGFCDLERIKSFIAQLQFRNSRNDEEIIRELRKNPDFLSVPGFKKLQNGTLANFESALVLCFILHCNPNQAEELLHLYGFCWQTDKKSKFLQEQLKQRHFNLYEVASAWCIKEEENPSKAA